MDRNAMVKIIAISLTLLIVVSVMALVLFGYLSSRGIDILPEELWEELHGLKHQVYDNMLRNVLSNLKHKLFEALHLENPLVLLPPRNLL